MLTYSILAYILLTLTIGFWSSIRVKSSVDFILAGKSLSAFVVGVTIFSTWFGSEMIMGVPALFVQEGIQGLIIDIGGTLLCLTIVSLFFTKPIYKLNILTVNDFYKLRYGPKIELVTSLIMIFSYFAWVASQFLALALIFNSLFGLEIIYGIFTAAAIVLAYTVVGGMWAVSITDLIQAVVITLGLVYILISLNAEVPQGIGSIFNNVGDQFYNFLPGKGLHNWSDYIHKWMIFGIGSIVSQEVYQRVLSARNAKSAQKGVFFGGILMFTIGLLPSIAGLAIHKIHPELLAINEGQNLLLEMVLKYMDLPIKVIFFGALISAILSTSSGAILAPATVIAENIIKPNMKNMTDRKMLFNTRLSVLIVALVSCVYALLNDSIHGLVVNSVLLITTSMTAAFIFGLYWKRTSVFGAVLSIVMGTFAWLFAELLNSALEPTIVGFFASIIGIVVGSLAKSDDSHEVFLENSRI